MNIQNVVLIGGGVLGSQIAYQSAYKGKHVTIWLRSEGSIGRAQPKLSRLHGIYLDSLEKSKDLLGKPGARVAGGLFEDFSHTTPEDIDALKAKADAAYAGLVLTTDLEAALKDADLVIEALAEDPAQKTAFYEKAAPLLPEKTILATNSSTLLPSQLAPATGRPDRFLAIHFANEIWSHNTAEIMGHAGTDPAVVEDAIEFAKSIGMIPLVLHKEQPGYILNSILVPFLTSAQALLANGIADPETIDLTWKLGTGAPLGPFQILDIVGLTTAYNIVSMRPEAKDPESTYGKIAATLKSYIDAGKTGINAGEGFYKYSK
ncbi:MAG: 3-hydroxyacyl-CoA dehydrogenase [Lachnospiraceae bacterium]|jgi:3-hydroxybutyryl-CoA dehydrogenase|nr:3-hydroxyacyl-CoA dehydrogenase [Lachnospiraceae bacterium]